MTLYLIVEAGGTQLAIPAADIRTVMTSGTVVSVPHAAAHVAGLAAMRSEVITVVDPIAAIRGGAAQCPEAATLVAIAIDGQYYGLIVDDVDDAVEIEGAPERFGAAMDEGWRAVSLGVISVGDKPIIVIDPQRIVGNADRIAA